MSRKARHRLRLTRRGFLGAAAGAAGAAVLPAPARAANPDLPRRALSMLVDTTRCIGCRACVRACDRVNEHPVEDAQASTAGAARQEATWQRWTSVNREGPAGDEPAYVKRQCLHCLEPACASVCPVGALYQTEQGPVIYRPERCIGCRYCMMACPFDVPRFEWDNGLTPVIGKCQFCMQKRLVNGQPPACAEACPTGALRFGVREELLFHAHARITARPEEYHPRVYGETEAGGTCWLYLARRPFGDLGFREDLRDGPLPSLTWAVISRLPVVAAALAGLFGLVAVGLTREEKPK